MEYSLFYNKEKIGDVLMIVFNEEAIPTKIVKEDNLVKIYKMNDLIGINIFNILDSIKIHANGLIPLPVNQLIDVINEMLVKHNLEPLPYKRSSGFVIGKIISCMPHEESEHLHILKVNVGDEVLDIVCGASNVENGEIVVVAKIGTTMFDGSKIKKGNLLGVDSYGMCCSERELNLTNDQNKHGLLLLDDSFKPGEDFFSVVTENK